EFVAVWVGPSGSNKAVFARRFNADGSAKGSEQVVAQSDSENAPDVATNSTGRFVVVWRDGTDDQVRARVFNASGNPDGGAFKVDSSPNNQFAPTVGMNENGDFTVAWQTNAAGGILYRQFSADGNPNGASRSAGTGGDKDYAPSLSMNGDGMFCIAWRDDLLNVWTRQFQSNGDPIDNAFKASQSGGDQLEPTCAIDGSGNFMVAWKYRPGGGDGSIRGRMFNSGAPPGLSVTCTADPTEGLPPLSVAFTAQASGGNGSYSYSWDFDDGDTSSAQNPSHTYTASGTYKPKVTATSGADTATCKQTISVGTASSVVVTELTVTSVNRNTPETILSVKGSGFQDGATVSFNDPGVVVFVTNWIDSTRIKVRINVLSTAFLGLHDVTVVNPDQTQGTGPELLKVLQNGKYPAPSILTVDPSSVAAGSTPVLKITGADFARDSQALAVDAGAAITIDSIDWISPTEIHAHANVSPDAVCGVHDVVVSNGSASSQPCSGCLSVSSGGLSIGLVKPASLHVGEGPVDVTITGCGFASTAVAKIKGTQKISQTNVDSTTIILRVTVRPDTAPGFKKVLVKNSSIDIKKRKDLFQVKP
ncbi:MAG TPA: PKD domain-containing protein, partial [Acidobacteriota bacterium]|nr:PKD domain-containing protein [Acidobacteriota bacterium]